MNAVVQSVPRQNGGALIPHNLGSAVRMAELMGRARTLPHHLHNSPGDCLMVVEQAMRWGMSPFAVAQATSVIQGRLMYEGKLVAAALHTSGALASRLAYDYSGEGDAREVSVSAVLAGEAEPRSVVVRLKDARTNNKVWQTQPDQQLAYHGARVWARRYAPEVMLGVYSPEEMQEPVISGAAHETRLPPPPPPPAMGEVINDGIPQLEEPAAPADPLVTLRRRLEACMTEQDVLKVDSGWRNGLSTARDNGREIPALVQQAGADMLAKRYAQFQPQAADQVEAE